MLCRAATSALVVVDIQARLSEAMQPACLATLLRNVKILLQAADKLAIPVIATEQYPDGLGHIRDDIAQALPNTSDTFEKTCFSACSQAEFSDTLAHSDRKQVVLAGMEAHICVLQTALQLRERFEVFVVEDAVCSRSDTNKHNAIARLRHAGVVMTNTESVLFEWLGDARHKHFKTLSQLIR